jgi:hypothetical protein
MSDEPKNRSRAWIGWAPLVMVILYPLSIVPSAIAFRWLNAYHVVADYGSARHALESFYAPIQWLEKQNPRAHEIVLDVITKLSP